MIDTYYIPHDLDAEEAVIGSLMLDPEVMAKLVPILNAEDFYRERNQWLYEAALELHRAGEPTDQIMIAHQLAQDPAKRAWIADVAGCAAYMNECIRNTPTTVHAVYYAGIIKEMADRRRAIQYGLDGKNKPAKQPTIKKGIPLGTK